MNTWETVPYVADDDAVNAESVNKSIRALVNRTERLATELKGVTAGRALVERDCACAPSVVQGTPVFWNADTERYEPAIAGIKQAGCGTHGILDEAAYVVGVCWSKSNSTTGDIITVGVTTNLQLSSVVDGPVTDGPYYLSTTEAGKLVRATPANGVYVLSVQGDSVRVCPIPLDTITAHVHMRIPLEHGTLITGAGVPNGWSTTFNTEIAPTGARYVYVPSASERINLVQPMLPDTAALAEVNGAATDSGIIVDGNGIWWMSTDMGPTEAVSVVINFTQSQLATSQSVVTSLDSTSNVLKITDPLGNPATRGPLRLAFVGFDAAGGNDASAFAFKSIDKDGRMIGGPVVTGIRSMVPTLDVTTADGVATIVAVGKDAALQGEPTIAVVRGGIQDTMKGIPYIGMPAGQASSIAFRFELPIITEGEYELDLELMILGTASGDLPSLGVECSVVPSTETSGLVQNLTTAATTVALGATAVTKGSYVRGHLATKVPVTPGDMVFLTISRNDASYSGTVGIMFAKYIINKKA